LGGFRGFFRCWLWFFSIAFWLLSWCFFEIFGLLVFNIGCALGFGYRLFGGRFLRRSSTVICRGNFIGRWLVFRRRVRRGFFRISDRFSFCRFGSEFFCTSLFGSFGFSFCSIFFSCE